MLWTYEAERRPHVDATIRVSERIGPVVMTTSKRLATSRDRIIRRMLETDDGRNHLEQMRYRPANAIAAGLVHSGDLGAGTAVAQPRVFDAATSKVRMLDELAGRGWTTIGVDVPAAAWIDAESVCAMTGARRLHVVVDQTLPNAIANARVLVDVDGGLEHGALAESVRNLGSLGVPLRPEVGGTPAEQASLPEIGAQQSERCDRAEQPSRTHYEAILLDPEPQHPGQPRRPQVSGWAQALRQRPLTVPVGRVPLRYEGQQRPHLDHTRGQPAAAG